MAKGLSIIYKELLHINKQNMNRSAQKWTTNLKRSFAAEATQMAGKASLLL
jgi:hypothetical protein